MAGSINDRGRCGGSVGRFALAAVIVLNLGTAVVGASIILPACTWYAVMVAVGFGGGAIARIYGRESLVDNLLAGMIFGLIGLFSVNFPLTAGPGLLVSKALVEHLRLRGRRITPDVGHLDVSRADLRVLVPR